MSNILFKTANKGNKSNYKKNYKNEGGNYIKLYDPTYV